MGLVFELWLVFFIEDLLKIHLRYREDGHLRSSEDASSMLKERMDLNTLLIVEKETILSF